MVWEDKLWILYGFGIVIVVMGAAHFIEARKRVLCRRFSKATGLILTEPSRWLRFFKWFFYSCSIFFICVALSDPRFGVELRKVSHKGRDIVFVLDVSKSMLAKDILPNRLERAKLDIRDYLNDIRGHRLGLILFAGERKEVCPLTYDYRHFERILMDAHPSQISKGGTNIGDSLRTAIHMLESGKNVGNERDIILITDGQDLQGFYEEAAKTAGEKNIAITCIGIGESNPSHIPLKDGNYIQHEGKKVQTSLNPQTLTKISELSKGGFYLSLSSTPDWMNKIFQHIDQKNKESREIEQRERLIPRFQWALIPGLFFLGCAACCPERRKRKAE